MGFFYLFEDLIFVLQSLIVIFSYLFLDFVGQIGVLKKSADHALLNIKKWMAPKKVGFFTIIVC